MPQFFRSLSPQHQRLRQVYQYLQFWAVANLIVAREPRLLPVVPALELEPEQEPFRACPYRAWRVASPASLEALPASLLAEGTDRCLLAEPAVRQIQEAERRP